MKAGLFNCYISLCCTNGIATLWHIFCHRSQNSLQEQPAIVKHHWEYNVPSTHRYVLINKLVLLLYDLFSFGINCFFANVFPCFSHFLFAFQLHSLWFSATSILFWIWFWFFAHKIRFVSKPPFFLTPTLFAVGTNGLCFVLLCTYSSFCCGFVLFVCLVVSESFFFSLEALIASLVVLSSSQGFCRVSLLFVLYVSSLFFLSPLLVSFSLLLMILYNILYY